MLETKGRTSGLPRRTPVNLLTIDGQRYLVSPRGEGQWVRNVRADGGRLALLLGRKREEITAVEVPVAEREPILRAYLKRWKAEVGIFFDGVDADSSAEELARIAPRAPGLPALAPDASSRPGLGSNRHPRRLPGRRAPSRSSR